MNIFYKKFRFSPTKSPDLVTTFCKYSYEKHYFVLRKYSSKTYFHFCGHAHQDLILNFSGRKKELQISLKNVNNKETLLVSIYLKTLSDQLFSDIRLCMRNLTLEGIREILKVEVRRSILQRCVKRIIYQTPDKRSIDFRSLKLYWER